MNTKNLILAIIFLISGSITTKTSAQEHIDALIKKCDSMESVSMTVIRNKDKDTKKVSKEIISITINSDAALVNEFLIAFQKDEPNATQVIDTKKNGKLMPQFYRFDNVSYSFSSNGDKSAEITVIDKRKQ